MRATRASERGFSLYQLLISLVVLVIAASLGLAYHHGRQSQPIFADVEARTAD